MSLHKENTSRSGVCEVTFIYTSAVACEEQGCLFLTWFTVENIFSHSHCGSKDQQDSKYTFLPISNKVAYQAYTLIKFTESAENSAVVSGRAAALTHMTSLANQNDSG